MATDKDRLILKLKKELEEKKVQLANAKFRPITNCNLVLFSQRYNINVLDKETLGQLIGTVNSMAEGFKKSFPDENLMISGYSHTAWIKDLTSKYESLNLKALEDSIKKAQEVLDAKLSEEHKDEKDFADIQQLLKGL